METTSFLTDQCQTAVVSRMAVLLLLFAIMGVAAYLPAKRAAALYLRKWVGANISCPTRRQAAIGLAITVAYLVAVGYAFTVEPNWVATSRIRVGVRELNKSDHIRIAQISDFHMESGSRVRVDRALAIVGHESPDIIVLTGDFANDYDPAIRRELTAFLESMVSVAPTFAVLGNWDGPDIADMLKREGVRVLEDEALQMQIRGTRLRLVGMNWTSSNALSRLLEPDGNSVRIVVSHTPDLFEDAARLGADVYLCGHTHGGQVRLPVYGTVCTTYSLVGKYQAGIYQRCGTSMYVNRGLGLEGGAPKIRFWCRPEVAIIELTGRG